MKYSIIIPTYNKCDELLKPCIESIVKYTDLIETEIIIVANGCTDNTAEWVKRLQLTYHTVHLVEFVGAIGFTKAVNEGMRQAKGEYFIILNNDTILLPQEKNQWLEILNNPFTRRYTKAGITGPMKVPNDATGLPFLIFFCVMVSRTCYDEIGPMDEVFSPGYGEDTDWCLRAESMGYDVVQVPKDSNQYYEQNRMVGDFPIYHAGNQTFKDHPDAELIHRNNRIIKERWGKKPITQQITEQIGTNPFDEMFKKSVQERIDKKELIGWRRETPNSDIEEVYGTPKPTSPIDISKAKNCDGYMADSELEWLATQARTHEYIIEVGSWHGKSSRALGDNLMGTDGHLVCIDHWKGSEQERDNNHKSAYGEDGDAAHLEFLDNMFDLISRNRVSYLRLSSKNAAKYLIKHQGNKADMIFIDGGHTYEEVRNDILNWLPLLKLGGLICGHDMFHVNNPFPGVGKAVEEIFSPIFKQAPNTSIWYVEYKYPITPVLKAPVQIVKRPPCVYDCFPYNNEVDVLLERFKTLYNAVDRFIIVEAMETHAGKPKNLTFEANIGKFQPFLNKVTYLVIEKFPETQGTITDQSWARERFQRDYIMNGITDCQDDDIIIISDCDEIPNPGAIVAFKELENKGHLSFIAAFSMDLYYYNEHTKAVDKWLNARITTYDQVKKLGPCGIRYYDYHTVMEDGGRHLSYFGGVDAIVQKIEDTAHQEYNTAYYKDKSIIQSRISDGVDVFGRNSVKFERV